MNDIYAIADAEMADLVRDVLLEEQNSLAEIQEQLNSN